MINILFTLGILSLVSVVSALLVHMMLRRYMLASLLSSLLANAGFWIFYDQTEPLGIDGWTPALLFGGTWALVLSLITGIPISLKAVAHPYRRCTLSILALGLLLFLPVPFWNFGFSGIDGYYPDGMCMGGHEEFLEISDESWYSACPGHKSRDWLGSIETVGSRWYILAREQQVAEIRREDHQLIWKGLDSGEESRLDRVRNPWRLWLAWIFPE